MAWEEKEDIDKQKCDISVQQSYLKKERKKIQFPICDSTAVDNQETISTDW